MNAGTRHPGPLEGVSLRRVRYAPDVRQRRHHHERTSLTLVFDGSLDEVVGRAEERAGPLSVVYKPAGTVHRNRIGPRGAMTLQLEFAPDFMSETHEPSEWGWAHGGVTARRFLALFADWNRGERPANLEARLFDVLADLGRETGADRTLAPVWLQRIVEELEDTYRNPRRVRDLAGEAAVHPVALARAHRRHFGCSITDRLRSRRVRSAASMLGGETETLSGIAFAQGFADQSHLTRVFKTETGMTPGAYRSLIRG